MRTHREPSVWVDALATAKLAVHSLRAEQLLVVELSGEGEGGGKIVAGDAFVVCTR